jgi:hypothetical protein
MPTGLVTALCLPRHRCSSRPLAVCGPTGHFDHPTARRHPVKAKPSGPSLRCQEEDPFQCAPGRCPGPRAALGPSGHCLVTTARTKGVACLPPALAVRSGERTVPHPRTPSRPSPGGRRCAPLRLRSAAALTRPHAGVALRLRPERSSPRRLGGHAGRCLVASPAHTACPWACWEAPKIAAEYGVICLHIA